MTLIPGTSMARRLLYWDTVNAVVQEVIPPKGGSNSPERMPRLNSAECKAGMLHQPEAFVGFLSTTRRSRGDRILDLEAATIRFGAMPVNQVRRRVRGLARGHQEISP